MGAGAAPTLRTAARHAPPAAGYRPRPPFLALHSQAMLLALGFASAVGVIAGLYPVIHASKLQPIAAVCTQLQLQRVFRCGTIDA